MSDVLAELEAMFAGMSREEKAEADKLISSELEKPFLPNPGPQTQALESKADILLFGGSAGGGKTALEIGAYFTGHHTGVVFRREGTQLDGLIEFCKQIGEPNHGKFVGGNENVFKRNDGGRLKFAGLKEADDWRKHAGNAKDLLCFDEAGEFLRDQVMNSIGWLRSTRSGQRCRVILGSNPPRGGDGEWLIEEFAPWLDPLYSNPAKDGELRWAIVVAGVTEWVEGAGKFMRGGEEYEAMSRTFIPSRLNDNPYLSDTGYRAKLQALPEPLRSQLLYGDFVAGREDHEWQVIPTEWVRLANERWRNAPQKRRRMVALAADVAGTGGDDNCVARLHEDAWFDEPVNFKGLDLVEAGEDALLPSRIADRMLSLRKDGADMSVDGTGGWGSGVRARLTEDHKMSCASVVFSSGSIAKTADKSLGFYNLRAEMYWKFREALDPDNGDDVALPPDKRLTAELTIPRYKIKGTNILIEAKDDIKKRVGSSPDRADAYVIAWHRRIAAHKEAQRKQRAASTPIKLKMQHRPSATGWMG